MNFVVEGEVSDEIPNPRFPHIDRSITAELREYSCFILKDSESASGIFMPVVVNL